MADLKPLHAFDERSLVGRQPCRSQRSRRKIAEGNELALKNARVRRIARPGAQRRQSVVSTSQASRLRRGLDTVSAPRAARRTARTRA